jgi:hypothetical protein
MGSSQPYPRSSFSNQSHSQSSSQGHHSHGHGKVDSHSHPPQSHFGAENRNFNHGGNHGNSEEPHDNCESMGDEFGNNLESMSIDDGKSSPFLFSVLHFELYFYDSYSYEVRSCITCIIFCLTHITLHHCQNQSVAYPLSSAPFPSVVPSLFPSSLSYPFIILPYSFFLFSQQFMKIQNFPFRLLRTIIIAWRMFFIRAKILNKTKSNDMK